MGSLTKSDVESVSIELDVGGVRSLYVMMAADGSIDRMGRGTIDNDEYETFSGITEDRLFESLVARIDDELFQYAGSYHDANPQGELCKLTVHFQGADDSAGFEFVYGAETQGPPTEICDLVVASVDLTDPWYERQLRDPD